MKHAVLEELLEHALTLTYVGLLATICLAFGYGVAKADLSACSIGLCAAAANRLLVQFGIRFRLGCMRRKRERARRTPGSSLVTLR